MSVESPLPPADATADQTVRAIPPDTIRQLPHGLRALAHRDFRLFWTGAIVSTTGSNMQLAAIGWVVAIQTGSAFKVSLVAFAGLIPLMVLAPWGGALADRLPRRKLLLVTQGLMMGVAALLSALWQADLAPYWVLFALSLATGITGAISAPTWQALVPELVPPRDLQNAVMLNSTQFNISRALGPMIAGFTIARWGPGVSFFYNAVSYLAVLGALLLMSPARPHVHRASTGFMREFREGVAYARRTPGVVVAIGTVGVMALLGVPLISLIPIIAVKSFSAGAEDYGLLAGAFGIGAIGGAFLLGTFDGVLAPSRIAAMGIGLYAGAIVALGLAPNLGFGITAMALVGAGFLTIVSTLNSAVQTLCDDAVRGRVLSLWLTLFGTAAPLGVIVQGILADRFGPRVVVTSAGALLGAYLVFLTVKRLLPRLDPDESIWRRDYSAA